jgi:tRNA(Ile)-lysidine synthase
LTSELPARLAAHLAHSGLVEAGAPVVVAFSGGLDSLCLLHMLRFNLHQRPLLAAHYDHRMRAESAQDAEWVAGLCLAWDVPLVSAVSLRPLRSETEARSERYAFLAAVARQAPGARVATAHHADDQAETVLLRLLRGTGIRGLAGIPAERGPFIRPLLPFGRSELARYSAAAGLQPRDDPSNREVGRPRNEVRHLLLPRLEYSRPGAREALLRLAAAAAEAERTLELCLEEVEASVVTGRSGGEILLASNRLRVYHPRIRALLLRRLLRVFGSAPGQAGTRAALQFISSGRSGGRIDLPGGVIFERSFDTFVLRRAEPPERDVPAVIPAPGDGRARARIGGRRYTVCWAGTDAAGGECEASRVTDGWFTVLDPAAVRFPLTLRGWLPGDRIRLAYGSKKLKKVFGEVQMTRAARSRTPVLAEPGGQVLWLVGVQRSIDAPAHGRQDVLRITVMDG